MSLYHVRPDAPENPYAEEEAYQRTKAVIEFLDRATPEQIATFEATDRDGYDTREDRYSVCRVCGQSGYAGQYPFSTIAGGDVCDDCI